MASLIQSHIEEFIPVNTGPPWFREALDNAIKNGPHTSTCTPEMVGFIRGDIQRRVQDVFRIFFPVADTVQIFGERLNISRIAAVPQAQRQLCLILSLSA